MTDPIDYEYVLILTNKSNRLAQFMESFIGISAATTVSHYKYHLKI